MKVLTFDDEAGWLEARRSYITATMIARLAASRAEWPRLWRERETGESSFHGNAYTEWGKSREPEIAEYARMFVDSRLEHSSDLYVHDDGVSACSPDMVALDDDGLLAEIKTVKAENAWPVPPYGADPRDFIPARYFDQVQWQLMVTGAQECIFLWEPHTDFTPGRIEWCVVKRNNKRIEELCAIRDEFLAGDWRDDESRPEVDELLQRIKELRLMKRPLEEEEREVLDRLREALGDSDVSYEGAGLRLSYTLPKPRRTWQGKEFAKAHPDLAAEFTREVPATKRTLRVTEVA
ncbi:YqaJ-like viral recombinase domain protein [Corynebacterium ciconiae DSM 44920]|uniref:YqaJ viral recombinase family protein n=1 Tax=Corynebacterium ciconiae TaxID=227319 RepID=UPI002647E0F6|nr:YqaJ viral recombinase family protein [Corynebacterium ciconiae]WKD60892.1 YqaJ-like viral recombinase domain protein [Corynebacterium ciconiae DSM 44920]